MSITARYIDKGYFIIGDQEYGQRLCRISFVDDMIRLFTNKQLQLLADDFKDCIVERLKLETEKAEDHV